MKALQPPEDFLMEIRKILEVYLWETGKHWVNRAMTCAPRENGGLGIKSPKIQLQVFRLRALAKAQTVKPDSYFLQVLISQSNSILFKNSPNLKPYYESTRTVINRIRFTFYSLPPSLYSSFYLQNEVIFGKSDFTVLSELGHEDVSSVNTFIDLNIMPNIRQPRLRKLNAEIQSYKCKIEAFHNSLQAEPNGTKKEELSFQAWNPLKNSMEEYNRKNDYIMVFFGIFSFESFTKMEIQKLKSTKWKRLIGTMLSTTEIDIIWRLWNSALITFKIANRMNLMSSGNCAYCNVVNPNCHHLVFCKTAESLWTTIWDLLRKMERPIRKRERMYGYDESPLENTLIFLGIVILYRRFLYNINSGKKDYDLVKSYKQLLYEKIYINYVIHKTKNTLIMFADFWGNGTGIFKHTVESIDIRL